MAGAVVAVVDEGEVRHQRGLEVGGRGQVQGVGGEGGFRVPPAGGAGGGGGGAATVHFKR